MLPFPTREGDHRSRRSLRRSDDFVNAFSLLSARQLLSSVSSQQQPCPSPSPSSPPLPTRTSISPTSTLHLSSPDFVYVILHEERQVVRLHRISFAHSSTPSSEHHSLIHTFQRFSATDTPCKTTNGSTLTAYLLPNHLCLSPTALPRTMRAFSIMHRLITITEVAPARDTT